MKLLATLPLVFLVASSACAQHGAPAGRSSGSAPAAHSFTISTPGPIRTSNSAPQYRPNREAPQYGSRYTSPIGPPPFGGTQPVPGKHYPYPPYPGRGNRPYYSSSGLYLVPGYLNYGGYYGGYYGNPDDSSYSDQSAAPAGPDMSAQAPPPDEAYRQAYAEPPARPAYEPQAAAAAPVPDQPEVTLVFKDGRPSQQVQNYAVTPNTLYVLDGERRRDIPLDQIDLPKTEKINRDAGLDFEIPADVN